MYVSNKVKSVENISKSQTNYNYESSLRNRPKSVSDILKQIEGEANKRPESKIDHKKEMRNFSRENVFRMREIQRACRQMKENKATPLKPNAKLLSANVPMPLWRKPSEERYGQDNHQHAMPLPYIEKKELLRGDRRIPQIPKLPLVKPHDSSSNQRNASLSLNLYPAEKKPSTLKSSLRRSSSTPCLIKENAKCSLKLPDNYKFGVVPKYLQLRQKQWREEAERKLLETPDPTVPPGLELLSESERLLTIDQLKQRYDELMKQVVLLPVCINTLKTLKRKEDLEKEIIRVEEAMKIFAHPKVYIKKDA